MANTTAIDVFRSFESSFADKQVLPEPLVFEWLKKSIGRYSVELSKLDFDEELMEFENALDRYTIDTLAEMMKQLYQERQWSMVNKRVSIVTRDLSVDGNNGAKAAAQAELDYVQGKVEKMVGGQAQAANG